MEYVKLGRTGLDVSRICLGCMSYGVAERGLASPDLISLKPVDRPSPPHPKSFVYKRSGVDARCMVPVRS